jgi:hypothetical protein
MEFYILINNVELVKMVGESTAQGAKTGTERSQYVVKGVGESIDDSGRKLKKKAAQQLVIL